MYESNITTHSQVSLSLSLSLTLEHMSTNRSPFFKSAYYI